MIRFPHPCCQSVAAGSVASLQSRLCSREHNRGPESRRSHPRIPRRTRATRASSPRLNPSSLPRSSTHSPRAQPQTLTPHTPRPSQAPPARRSPQTASRPPCALAALLATAAPSMSGRARSTGYTRTRPGAPRGTLATTTATSGFCAGSTPCPSPRSPAPPAARPYSRSCEPAESKSAGNGHPRPANSAGCSMRLTAPAPSRSRVASGRTCAASAAPLLSRSSQSSSSASRTPSREVSAPLARCRHAPDPVHYATVDVHDQFGTVLTIDRNQRSRWLGICTPGAR